MLRLSFCVMAGVVTTSMSLPARADVEWAYQVLDESLLPQRDLDIDLQAPRSVPGSSLQRSQEQIDDHWNPPDWFPDDHYAPVPEVVLHGAGPDVRACGACHGFTGAGHPESSHLAGLTAAYIEAQMADFKSGARKDRNWMNLFDVSEEQTRIAAEWFAGLEVIDWIDEVIEADSVPRTYIGDGRMRHLHPDGGTEPIDNRIIEVPQDRELATARHPYSGFTVYAPVGSLARGEDLVTTGAGGRTIQCFICHGVDLNGLGDVPRLAGVSPLYTVRQLNDFKNGDRAGSLAPLMTATVMNLTDEDMVAIAAYLGSLDP
ncbi:MAG: c-type cytochrome [Rhodospirillaceae bacterium]|nr:c-type cytochrome [Rhodospirillaceae bacterium]